MKRTDRTLSSLPSRAAARLAAAAAVSVLLAACGSSVKLDQAPVADRTGMPVSGLAGGAWSAGAQGGAANERGVNGVQADGFNAGQPPANVKRIVYFDFDSSAIRAEYDATIEGHAKFLNADRKRRVNLEGHTDERGGREYNLALGQQRAEAVRRALALSGVPDAQMEAVSFGKEKPAAQGSGEEVWAQNRRVELTYR